MEKQLRRLAVEHVWHHEMQVSEYADVGPMMLVEGQGIKVRDSEGHEYIDATSISGVSQIGHGRQEMAKAIADQAMRLEYAALANGFSNVPATQLAHKLAQITPGDLAVSYFCCSGSEAIDTALKIARQYQAKQGYRGRTKVISRHGSRHGVTFGALSATGLTAIRTPSEPLLPGFSHIEQPYCYRCELGLTYPECHLACAEMLERQILFEGPETVAAFVGEPIAVPQAVKIPPAEYWSKIREICDRYGVLLIMDEIFCGFGRTGKWFGCEHWGVQPDIMVISKGLTSGYVPLSAAIATRQIADAFKGAPSNALQHGGTYSGHPVACAAGLANIAIMEREQLPERAAQIGAYLLEGLRSLQDHPLIGNISGIGLLASVELVADKQTKRPAAPELSRFIGQYMLERGILARSRTHTMYFYPPLIIESRDIDCILDAFRFALNAVPNHAGTTHR